jgi:hypothetical protein
MVVRKRMTNPYATIDLVSLICWAQGSLGTRKVMNGFDWASHEYLKVTPAVARCRGERDVIGALSH